MILIILYICMELLNWVRKRFKDSFLTNVKVASQREDLIKIWEDDIKIWRVSRIIWQVVAEICDLMMIREIIRHLGKTCIDYMQIIKVIYAVLVYIYRPKIFWVVILKLKHIFIKRF